MPAPAAGRRCSWSRRPTSCASTSTCRRTTCRASGSAPRRKSRCPNIRAGRFPATVEASAQAVDVASGTTRMQLVVDNAASELMTGAFANVTFELPHPEIAVNVPASALIFNQQRPAGRNRRPRRTASFSSRSRSHATSATRSRSRRASPPTIVSCINPPDGVVTGDQVRDRRRAGSPGEPETASAK